MKRERGRPKEPKKILRARMVVRSYLWLTIFKNVAPDSAKLEIARNAKCHKRTIQRYLTTDHPEVNPDDGDRSGSLMFYDMALTDLMIAGEPTECFRKFSFEKPPFVS